MITERTIRSYLRRSITLAERLEVIASPLAAQRKGILVGFGFLVRNRQLGQAILQLGNRHAYEKRILIRTMVEIHINYAWIRLKNGEFRANRFIKFGPIEQLKTLEDLELSGLMHRNDYTAKLKEFRRKRAKVRYLFRHLTSKGKPKWDRAWASVTSLESRLEEVLKSQTGKYDSFLYALYRLFSSAVHGGPTSLNDVLEPDIPLRAKPKPESNPASHLGAASVILIATMVALAESSNVIEALEPELSKLKRALEMVQS